MANNFNKSSGGNPFGGGSRSSQRPGGAGQRSSGLPARSEPRNIRPAGNTSVRRTGGSGISMEDIPWKAIIYVVLAIFVMILLVCFWDVIVYVLTNLLKMLLLIAVALFLIRCLTRRRR